MSPNALLAPCHDAESKFAAPTSATLGEVLDQIRRADLDSLYAAFEVPTIFAAAPWTVDAQAVIADHDGDAESNGLDYVLEVALARDVLTALATTIPDMANPTVDESLQSIIAFTTGGADASNSRSWVRRCIAC